VQLKKNLFILSAAALMAGSVACGDDDNGENGNGTPNGGGTPDGGGNGNGGLSILPDSIDCDETQSPPVCTIEAGRYGDMTWGPDNRFLITTDVGPDNVFIEDGATLTILPGTTIFADGRIALVIEQGARIEADGTAAEPIVFTSGTGSPARGDWGGLIINGFAPVNCGEGGLTCQGEGSSGAYGGDDPNDDSGVLRYVRVEYGGDQINDDDQYNGIAFQGVGSGTTIEYVQAHLSQDDGIEFFGGTANAKYLVVTGAGDDSIDWTFGFTGNIQYAVVQQYGDEGDRGVEADNNGSANDALPRSNPVLSNFTIRGPGGANINTLFREGMSGQMWASILSDSETCIDFDQASTWDQLIAGNIAFRNNVLNCTEPYNDNEVEEDDNGDVTFEDPCTISSLLTDGATDCGGETVTNLSAGNVSADPGFSSLVTQPGSTPVFTPSASGPAVGTAERGPDELGDNAFFDSVTYSGAIDPNGTDWTASWAAYPN